MRRYHEEGHFPPGRMRPKIEAAIRFLEDGRHVVFGHLDEALTLCARRAP
jgi:carbamate kinase